MENYKWLFKKQFMFFFKYRYLPYAWKDTKDLRSELPFWTSLFMNSSWDFCLLCLGVENDLLQLLYLPIKAFETTILKYSNDMSSPRFILKNSTVYICDFHEIKKHAQVKAMLAFTIENLWAASFLSIIPTPSMSLMYNLMILGQKTKILFEFFHIFINTYRLKWFCWVINDSNLMAFICFVLFVLAAKWLCWLLVFLVLQRFSTLPTKWLQSQNIVILENWFTVMMYLTSMRGFIS